MKSIEIRTPSHQSKVMIGEKLENATGYCPAGKTVIITDSNIVRIYREQLPPYPVIEIGLGENNKTISTLEYIFSRFVELEVDRSWFVLAVGGGIVCDVAGFAASVYMRGLSFGFVSTTLLSQVDASVGGKNGVNFQRFKNMVGTFNQPDFVICDPAVLRSLDEREYRAGFAEIVKAGAIKSADLFSFLEQHWQKALTFDEQVLNRLIYDSIKIKAAVVEADEREKGERRKLNFGHTFAHSFEKLTDMLHGEAVSVGMVLASALSEKLGFLALGETERMVALLKNLNLPVNTHVALNQVYAAMKQDKKREGDSIHLVLLKSIGEATIFKVTLNQLEELINDLRSHF